MGGSAAYRQRYGLSTPAQAAPVQVAAAQPTMTAQAAAPQPAPQSWSAPTYPSDREIEAMRRQMGQTGLEAGDPNASPNWRKLYANTSKSFNINMYLNSDGTTIEHPNSNWTHNYPRPYTMQMAKNDIARIDRGMKPLTRDVNTVRYTDGVGLSYILGMGGQRVDVDALMRGVKSGNTSLGTALKNANYVQKSYTSVSYDPNRNAYRDMPVRLEIKMRKGTKAIITSNKAESEIMGAHHLKYNFTGNVRVERVQGTIAGKTNGISMGSRRYNREQLVIEVEI